MAKWDILHGSVHLVDRGVEVHVAEVAVAVVRALLSFLIAIGSQGRLQCYIEAM